MDPPGRLSPWIGRLAKTMTKKKRASLSSEGVVVKKKDASGTVKVPGSKMRILPFEFFQQGAIIDH